MQYKLIKQFPISGSKIWTISDFGDFQPEKYPEFFEPIQEKRTYDDLKKWDIAWYIWQDEAEKKAFSIYGNRSETFLTREEAEDEHKRREWACRKGKFVPKLNEEYYYYSSNFLNILKSMNINLCWDIFVINLWLAFRTREECQKAIKEHELIRLFYTIR